MPKILRRAQVAGTDFPRVVKEPMTVIQDVMKYLPQSTHHPVFIVDGGLQMSTGKTAAQVAHAMWRAAMDVPRSQLEKDVPEVIEVGHEVFTTLKDEATDVILDSGLTDLSGPTSTVLVFV